MDTNTKFHEVYFIGEEYNDYLEAIGYSRSGLRIDRRVLGNFYKFNLRKRFGKNHKILEKEKKYLDSLESLSKYVQDEDINIVYIVERFMTFLDYIEYMNFIKVSHYYINDKENKTKELICNYNNVSISVKFTETEIDYIDDEEDEFKFKLLDFLNSDEKSKTNEKVTFWQVTITRKDSYTSEFNAIYPKDFEFKDADEKKMFNNSCKLIRKFIDNKSQFLLN